MSLRMKIVLIRHGKPKIDTSIKISAADFGAWVSDYDLASLDKEYRPTQLAIETATSSAFSVCSSLPRSIESAAFLGINEPDITSQQFRECEMPYLKWTYPNLSIKSWSVFFRLLQLAGYSNNAESYKDIKRRSEACAVQLANLSHKHGSVIFIGHGTLNWFLHKDLKKMGWVGPKKSAKKHWEWAEYNFNDTREG